jgi:predicted cupin superfamily sugar epimerase
MSIAPGADHDTVQRIITQLGLNPHPEGGWFVETWRHNPGNGRRGAGSAIYFLLAGEEVSRWHRIDATELWHFYAGDPLELHIAPQGEAPRTVVLGPDLASGQRPQAIVPAHAWQNARSLGAYTLVGTTVSPAFEFNGFELAPPDWQPPTP